MKKKNVLILLTLLVSACSSVKKDYVVTETFADRERPVWVDNIDKFEKQKDADSKTYKYFRSDAESINKKLCESAAIANRNKAIAGEINNTIDNLFTATTEVLNEEEVSMDNKKEVTVNTIKSRLVGVEEKDRFYEKRQYKVELGAEQDKTNYTCFNLARVKRKVHDNIISEMVKVWLKEIKDLNKKEKVSDAFEENAKEMGIDLDLNK